MKKTEKIWQEIKMWVQGARIRFDNCPLKWWKKHKEAFPRLTRMAQNYLNISCASADSERPSDGRWNFNSKAFQSGVRKCNETRFSCKKYSMNIYSILIHCYFLYFLFSIRVNTYTVFFSVILLFRTKLFLTLKPVALKNGQKTRKKILFYSLFMNNELFVICK